MFPYHQPTQPVPTQIHLNVKNLPLMMKFYEKTLGLSLHKSSEESAVFGSSHQSFLVLHSTPSYLSAASTESRLYHFAILVNEASQLAHVLQHLVSERYPIDGASDHQISHAVYLTDPEGNGIELAYDRDQQFWPHSKDGLLDGQAMIKPFDADLYLNMTYNHDLPWHHEAILGHVHFYAHDLDKTQQFMTKNMNYQLTMNLNQQALFFSVLKYHHHLGFNRWGNFKTPLGENRLGIRKLVFESTEIEESSTLIDPNGFTFELKKIEKERG